MKGTSNKMIIPFLVHRLNENHYSGNIEWVDKKKQIFRSADINTRNKSLWKENMSKPYIDWAQYKNKNPKKPLRYLKHKVVRALKCPSNVDNVKELDVKELAQELDYEVKELEHWRYWKILKNPEESPKSIQKAVKTNKQKKRTKEKKKKKLQSKVVAPISLEDSTISSNCSVQNDKVSGLLPSYETFSQAKSTLSNLPEIFLNLDDEPEFLNQLVLQGNVYLTNAISDTEEEGLDLTIESANQAQTLSPSQSLFEFEQSLPQISSKQKEESFVFQSDWENILLENSAEYMNAMVGFEQEEYTPGEIHTYSPKYSIISLISDF